MHDKDLTLARQFKQQLLDLDPRPDQDIVSEVDRLIEASRLEEEERLRLAAEAEARFQSEVKDFAQRISQTSQDFDGLRAELTQFQQRHNREEVSGLLQQLQDRQDILAITAVLSQLDQAVLSGDKAAITQAVFAENFRGLLDGFVGQEQLVFAHTIDNWQRQDGQRLTLTTSLRNGFKGYPENTINMKYDVSHINGVWGISSYQLME